MKWSKAKKAALSKKMKAKWAMRKRSKPVMEVDMTALIPDDKAVVVYDGVYYVVIKYRGQEIVAHKYMEQDNA